MSDNHTERRASDAPTHTTTIIEKRSGSGTVILSIIGLALLLAIGYFLLVNDSREDAKSEAVIGAAQSIDDAATSIGDTAKTAGEKLKTD